MNFLNTRKMFLQPHCKNIIELIFPCFSRFYMYGLLSIDCKSIPAKSNHCALVNTRCMSKRIILRTKTKYKAFRRTLLWFHGTFQFYDEIMNRKRKEIKKSGQFLTSAQKVQEVQSETFNFLEKRLFANLMQFSNLELPNTKK